MYNLLKTKNALYVGDEKELTKDISELLGSFFNNFYMVSDSVEAWEILSKHSIDAVLVDIELPQTHGIELIKKIRNVDKEIPVVAISAYTKSDHLSGITELKLGKYIVKPITPKKIHTLLNGLNEDFSNENILELAPNVLLNNDHLTIIYDKKAHNLSTREVAFLKMLARKGIATYDELVSLWGDTPPSDNAIRSFVRHLRKKLPDGLLVNRSGIGYALKEA